MYDQPIIRPGDEVYFVKGSHALTVIGYSWKLGLVYVKWVSDDKTEYRAVFARATLRTERDEELDL